MTGLRRILFAALFAFSAWRSLRHATLARLWLKRASRFDRNTLEHENARYRPTDL